MGEHQSMLERYLTPDLAARLGARVTSNGFTLDRVVASGRRNPDSNIGVYAGDAESYEVFRELFDPIILAFHGAADMSGRVAAGDDARPDLRPLEFGSATARSTRIRVARNLAGFAFTPAMSREARLAVEAAVVAATGDLPPPYRGTYHPFAGMASGTRKRLADRGLIFSGEDRFMRAAGILDDWPLGRGVFVSDDERFAIWVNEEDHLRVVVLRTGEQLADAHEAMADALARLEARMTFWRTGRLGYLTACPTNLGTGLRVSLRLELGQPLRDQPATVQSDGVTVRHWKGEHVRGAARIVDVSNDRTLGISGGQALRQVNRAVARILHGLDDRATAAE